MFSCPIFAFSSCCLLYMISLLFPCKFISQISSRPDITSHEICLEICLDSHMLSRNRFPCEIWPDSNIYMHYSMVPEVYTVHCMYSSHTTIHSMLWSQPCYVIPYQPPNHTSPHQSRILGSNRTIYYSHLIYQCSEIFQDLMALFSVNPTATNALVSSTPEHL